MEKCILRGWKKVLLRKKNPPKGVVFPNFMLTFAMQKEQNAPLYD